MQANWIKQVLSGWAQSEGGIAQVAHDLNHMWELAFNTSKVPRCMICFVGEDIRGDFSIAAATSRVDRHYVVLVTRGKGYTANRGDTLTQDIGEARPFYDLLEEARDLIRVLQFDASVTEADSGLPVDYHGIKPALPEDYPLDAYLIEFSIGTQLGVPEFNTPVAIAPSSPFHLLATSGSSVVNVGWDVDSWDATGTYVFKSTNGMTYTTASTLVGTTVLTYADTNITGGNIYWYKTQRYNAVGNSDYSNTSSVSV